MSTITFRVDEKIKKEFLLRLNKGMSYHLRKYIKFLISLSPEDCQNVVKFIEGDRNMKAVNLIDDEPKGRITRTSL